MGWGTNYKYDGYLSHLMKDDLKDKYEECKDINEMMWQKLLAVMAMTPADQKDCEGEPVEWADYIGNVLRDAKQTIEENLSLMARIEDCNEAMRDNPDDVYDDNDLMKKCQNQESANLQ